MVGAGANPKHTSQQRPPSPDPREYWHALVSHPDGGTAAVDLALLSRRTSPRGLSTAAMRPVQVELADRCVVHAASKPRVGHRRARGAGARAGGGSQRWPTGAGPVAAAAAHGRRGVDNVPTGGAGAVAGETIVRLERRAGRGPSEESAKRAGRPHGIKYGAKPRLGPARPTVSELQTNTCHARHDMAIGCTSNLLPTEP